MTASTIPRPSILFDDVRAGDRLPPVVKGPMSTMHIMRWSAAIENWHRIHYDRPFAVEHDGLDDVLVNGSWKQHVLAQVLKDWAGPAGWVSRLAFQHRAMDVRGALITATGEVLSLERRAEYGLVTCSVRLHGHEETVTTEGTGVVVLPLRGGPLLPDPLAIH